jgi:chorismate mutase
MAERDVVVHTLAELVDALDRRMAHVERVGEARIALDAASLRQEAVARFENSPLPSVSADIICTFNCRQNAIRSTARAKGRFWMLTRSSSVYATASTQNHHIVERRRQVVG